jgi:Na+/phosphate symporter
MIPTLFNATNQTLEGAFTITTTASGISPDISYLAPALVIIGMFCLFMYMVETHKDLGYAAIMIFTSFFAYSNTLLSSIAYTEASSIINLPFLMFLVGVYELLMTFLLLSETNNRRKADEKRFREDE